MPHVEMTTCTLKIRVITLFHCKRSEIQYFFTAKLFCDFILVTLKKIGVHLWIVKIPLNFLASKIQYISVVQLSTRSSPKDEKR